METKQDEQQQQQQQQQEQEEKTQQEREPEQALDAEMENESETTQENIVPVTKEGESSADDSQPQDTEIVPLEEDTPVTMETAENTVEGTAEGKEDEVEEEREPYVKMDGDPLLVLVTGANGFIATHIVQQLQEEGYRVRGTVRSLENEEKVCHIRELCPNAKYPVELVEAEMNAPDCWTSAVTDCTYVIHVASQFPAEKSKDENDVINPNVEGTINLLKACHDARTVRRVVLTSSVAAIAGTFATEQNKVFTEDDWTDLSKVDPYAKSKTLAEKAAWEYVQGLPEDERFGLAVINPAYVMGPVLNNSNFSSMVIPKRLLERSIPAIPKLNFPIVDVRDVARAHVKAMTLPEAEGKRFVLSHTNLWFKEIAQQVSKEFKAQGYNVPTTNCPYLFMWAASLFDKTIKMVLPFVGKVVTFDNSRMKDVLGIEPMDLNETILDMCYSMIENGMVKKTKKYRGRTPPGQEEPDQEPDKIEEGATEESHEEVKLNGGVVEDSKDEGETQATDQEEGNKRADPNGEVVTGSAGDEKVDQEAKAEDECSVEAKVQRDSVADEGDFEVRGQGEGQEADTNVPANETNVDEEEIKGESTTENNEQTTDPVTKEE